MKILLIAGHGNGDNGACANGYKEAELTREMVALIKSQLLNYENVSVDIADTSKDYYTYLQTHTYNFKPYDYVLEIHFNAAVNDTKGDGVTTGTEIYVTTSEAIVSAEQAIVDSIAAIGFRNRGVKRKNYDVISKAKAQGVSSALLEVCFIDDIDDVKLYQSRKNDIAAAIAEGIAKGYKLNKKTYTSTTEIVNALSDRSIITNRPLWIVKCTPNSNPYWLAYKAANLTVNAALNLNLKSVNDIVWELGARKIITEKALWLELLSKDIDLYWLAYKIANQTKNKV